MTSRIDPLPDAPSRSDPANFASEADVFVAALPGFAEQANALADEVEDNATDAAEAATVSQSARAGSELARDIAVAAANYQGDWIVGENYSRGESVSHAGQRWFSKQNGNLGNEPTPGAWWTAVKPFSGQPQKWTHCQAFVTPATGLEFTVPADVYQIGLYVMGGGGNGYASETIGEVHGGGGGAFIWAVMDVVPGQVISGINVGAAGASSSIDGLLSAEGGSDATSLAVGEGGDEFSYTPSLLRGIIQYAGGNGGVFGGGAAGSPYGTGGTGGGSSGATVGGGAGFGGGNGSLYGGGGGAGVAATGPQGAGTLNASGLGTGGSEIGWLGAANQTLGGNGGQQGNSGGEGGGGGRGLWDVVETSVAGDGGTGAGGGGAGWLGSGDHNKAYGGRGGFGGGGGGAAVVGGSASYLVISRAGDGGLGGGGGGAYVDSVYTPSLIAGAGGNGAVLIFWAPGY